MSSYHEPGTVSDALDTSVNKNDISVIVELTFYDVNKGK